MKKIIIAVAALLVAAGAQAQILSDATKYVKAGLALNSWAGEDVDQDYAKNALGYDLVVGFQKDFAAPGLYWGMEAGLGTRGIKNDLLGGGTSRYLHHNLKVTPIQIGYKVDFLDDWAVDFHLGAVASYDLFGNSVTKNGGNKYTTKMSEYGDTLNKFDVAINPGITFWYGQFGCELAYQRGFISWDKDGDLKYFSNDFKIRLAYRF